MAGKRFSSKASTHSGGRKTVINCITLEEITDEDKLLAREVWIQVEENYIIISKTLFSDLFNLHPEYKTFFKELFDPTSNAMDEDAWLNPRFEHHMIHVFLPALGNIVRSLDKPEDVREQMITLGKVHKNKGVGIKRTNVEALKGLFLETVRKCLGKRMLADHEHALSRIFSSAFCVFEEALEERT